MCLPVFASCFKKLMVLCLALTLAVVPKIAIAGKRLIMVTSEHCPFCKAWERDVGAVYVGSPYALNLPLTRVKLGDAMPDGLISDTSIIGTPTFIIFFDGREIDRRWGYESPEMFWWWLSDFAGENS